MAEETAAASTNAAGTPAEGAATAQDNRDPAFIAGESNTNLLAERKEHDAKRKDEILAQIETEKKEQEALAAPVVPEAKPDPKKELMSKRIEREAREQINQRKQRLENQRRAQDSEAREKLLAEREAKLAAAVTDPFGFLAQQGVDLAKAVPDFLEGKIGKPKPPEDPVQKELRELKEWKAQQEKSQKESAELAQQRSQRESMAVLHRDAGAALAGLGEDSFLAGEGGAERIVQEQLDGLRVAQAALNKGEIDQSEYQEILNKRLNAQAVAQKLEEHFEGEYKKKLTSKKFQGLFNPAAGTAQTQGAATTPPPASQFKAMPGVDPAKLQEAIDRSRIKTLEDLRRRQNYNRRLSADHLTPAQAKEQAMADQRVARLPRQPALNPAEKQKQIDGAAAFMAGKK
jgi:hypothetical protein